jgi:acetyltransferase
MLDAFFNPSSIAVIGASRKPGKVGHEVLRNIIDGEFKGEVYPINPRAETILGRRCYASVLEVPDDVDLGVVAVPARIVPRIVAEAGKKGVKGLIVISAGFKESGTEGTKLEAETLRLCKAYNMRLLGPNCLGVTDAYTPLNASFAPKTPPKGNVAFVSQSGALGTAVLDWATDQGIGFSRFVSLGNKADLNETEMMQALADDANTRVILLYLEGVVDGVQFLEAAREVTRKKPVAILKSGITEAGARAASSHTGTIAGSDLAFDVAFEKGGIIRVDTAEELFDLAEIFATQPIPNGASVAIITNAGGPGILAADACEKNSLRMASISPDVVNTLRGRLPPASNFFNPIDVLGDASAVRYRFALNTVLTSEEVDSVLVILTPQAMTKPLEIAAVLTGVKTAFPSKAIVASFLGGETIAEAAEQLKTTGVPNYAFPERAVKALATLVWYGEYLKTPTKRRIPRLQVNYDRARAVIDTAQRDGRLILTARETSEIATAYGIPTPVIELATTAEEAVLSADRTGYPVVLKIESPQILHKTDIGGVRLNVTSPDEVRKGFYELVGRGHIFSPRATIIGVNVQRMVDPGREVIVGMTRDITFGPLLMFGLGGIYVNFLKDVAFELAPMTRDEAVAMVQKTKAYTLLRGIRGERGSDITAIVDSILRVSQLVTDFNEINELDINPLFVYEKGCMALDVKITIKP